MNKIKNIIVFVIFATLLYSCGDDNVGFVNPFENIDYEELAISDNDTLVKFLKNHYYDKDVDAIKVLISGKTNLFEDDSLLTIKAKRNDIDHLMYVYKIRNGDPNSVLNPFPNPNPDLDKIKPSIADSIFTKYSGQIIFSSQELSDEFDSNSTGAWFTYSNLAVRGWSYGFMNFKGGYLEKELNGETLNGPINYLNGGKGILFIPSGLAYTSLNIINQTSSLVNSNLMFYIELLDFVNNTDHDGDGTASHEEDANGDGDLENDFSDADNPTLPDYLNPNIY